MACSSNAQSATERAIGPVWSRDQESGATPYLLTRPKVGLMPVTPQKAEGIRIDPPVSEPVAPRNSPAASPAAEPPLEPPGMQSRFHGLQVGWLTTPKANSCVVTLPSRTLPAA